MKKTTGLLVGMVVAAFLLGVVLVSGQQPQPPQPPGDPIGEAMFPPEMIMQHQREIGLTDEQKMFMRGEIQKTTTRFNELQWQLQDAVEALSEIMKSSSVNEQQALAQLDKVLDTERKPIVQESQHLRRNRGGLRITLDKFRNNFAIRQDVRHAEMFYANQHLPAR